MDKKGSGLVAALSIILVLILTLLCIMFATGMLDFNKYFKNIINRSDNATNENKTTDINYNGEYSYEENNYKATLDLLTNGTFYTKETGTIDRYYYGTYQIINDILKLNYIFCLENNQSSYNELNISKDYELKMDEDNIKILIDKVVDDDNGFGFTFDNIELNKQSDEVTLMDDFVNNMISLLKKEKEKN